MAGIFINNILYKLELIAEYKKPVTQSAVRRSKVESLLNPWLDSQNPSAEFGDAPGLEARQCGLAHASQTGKLLLGHAALFAQMREGAAEIGQAAHMLYLL